MKELTIMKIGGSVLTRKRGDHSLRADHVNKLGACIKTALAKKNQSLILVLGAGGAVHARAQKYRLQNGAITPLQIYGATTTHLAAKKLQMEVCALLLPHLRVMPLQTNNFFFSNTSGKILLKNPFFISELLHRNFIPTFYGDMIYDSKKHFRILSGDTISIMLAKILKASRILFATDVDGVYFNPKKMTGNANPIMSIAQKKLKALLNHNKAYKSQDTTGEMFGKLREIMSKPKRTKVFIFNGLKLKNIYANLTCKKIGTLIS